MDTNALYKIGYGLYVLTARCDGRDNGCIINTAMQITGDPVTVAVAVNKQNFTHDMIAASGLFNLSVLTVDTPFEVFKQFGFQSGRDVDKFAGLSSVRRAGNGLYYLAESTNACLSGRVIDQIDCGTHTLFRAELTDAVSLSDAESTTYSYYQANIKPKPQKPKKTVWRCKICGYEYEGEELPPDFICPLCKHGVSDFEKITV